MGDVSGQSELPQEQAPKWGDPISPERQAELQGYVDRWEAETDHGGRRGPFDREPGEAHRVRLTGADVSWLAEQSEPDESGLDEDGRVPNLHLEGAYLGRAYLKGADLREAHLEGADLEEADFGRADLRESHLEQAHCYLAHLETATLSRAHLEGTDLRGAFFGTATNLTGAGIFDEMHGAVRVADTRWGDVNLAVVDLPPVHLLGDEGEARQAKDSDGKPKSRATRLEDYRAAVRANRQLAVALRNQGMNEEADRFAYRAQFLHQQVLLRQRKFGGYIFSRLLDGLVGYGYKPVRGLIAYILVILGFAFAYGLATHGILTFGLPRSSIEPLQWYETLVLSISSFHGRGFFQPVQSLGDPVAIIAAAEAILGLLIEISFIATFTQRFFGR